MDVTTAAAAQRRGALLLAGSCVVFGLAAGHAAAFAVVVLLLGALVNVAGELQQAAGSWGLGYGLAPETAQGQYQGLWQTGFSLSGMLGPVVVTTLAVQNGLVGWVVLGAVIAGAGVLTVPATRWAARERLVVVG